MTNQELFDKVAVHLLKQKKKSETPTSGTCLYRAGKLRCAVGVLIPDEVYDPCFEGLAVDGFENRQLSDKQLAFFKWLDASFDSFQLKLLGALQELHDSNDVSKWRDYLTEMAREYELSTDAMDKVKNNDSV